VSAGAGQGANGGVVVVVMCEVCVWTLSRPVLQHRANETKTFIYVKIPLTTLCVTYKVRY